MFRATSALTGLLFIVIACTGSGATPAPTPLTVDRVDGPNIIPILASSETSRGPNRFLFGLTDRNNLRVAAPDVRVHLRFYDEAADRDEVVFEAESRFIWAIEGWNGLYAADVDFPRAGRWATRFDVTLPDGTVETARVSYDVRERTITPMIGEPAPSVDTPIAADVGGDLRLISTDPDPDPALYEVSIASALEAGEPFVVTFSTPAFCTSATCGPTLEVVKGVAADNPSMRFLHVEPYILAMGEYSLQPVLSDDGQLQATPWTDAWNLQTEPFVAVVDASGNVRAKFEATVAADELQDAIADMGPAAVAEAADEVTGIVVSINQASLDAVDDFTLRMEDGRSQVFTVGTLELDGDAFPANHLREHMSVVQPITVTFMREESGYVATRLEDDADLAQPSVR